MSGYVSGGVGPGLLLSLQNWFIGEKNFGQLKRTDVQVVSEKNDVSSLDL